MIKQASKLVVAIALVGALPAVASADGIIPSVGKGVGNVVEGTGEALFGTDDDTVVVERERAVVVEDRSPDIVVEDRNPDVVIADPAPGVIVAEPAPVVVDDTPDADVEVNVNN